MLAQGAERHARKAGAATEIEHALKTGIGVGREGFGKLHRHRVAEIARKDVVEDIGMLVEQCRHIGIGRFLRSVAEAHGRKPYGRAAAVVGVDGKASPVQFRGFLAPAGFLQFQRAVVGLGQPVEFGIGKHERKLAPSCCEASLNHAA